MVNGKTLKDKRVLITSGPTWVPIDDMRIISNRSTGLLGNILGTKLDQEKAKVTMLQGPVIHRNQNKNINTIDFQFYDEFAKLLEEETKKSYDIIIHAAAVSDFKLSQTFDAKISSDLSKINLELIPTEKLIAKIKLINPKTFLVGFKLESHLDKEALKLKVDHLIQTSGCDLVVANNITDTEYYGYILDHEKNILSVGKSREAIAENLITALIERV